MTVSVVWLVAAALVVGLANALSVSTPTAGTVWDASTAQTVTWASVASDPTSMSIWLVNNAGSSKNTDVGDNVLVSSGTYTIEATVLAQLAPATTYTIEFVSSTDNTTILAQSTVFQITNAAFSSPSSASLTTSTSASASTNSTSTSSSSSSNPSSVSNGLAPQTTTFSATGAPKPVKTASTPLSSTAQPTASSVFTGSGTAGKKKSACLFAAAFGGAIVGAVVVI